MGSKVNINVPFAIGKHCVNKVINIFITESLISLNVTEFNNRECVSQMN
jgi:hypothetical protein